MNERAGLAGWMAGWLGEVWVKCGCWAAAGPASQPASLLRHPIQHQKLSSQPRRHGRLSECPPARVNLISNFPRLAVLTSFRRTKSQPPCRRRRCCCCCGSPCVVSARVLAQREIHSRPSARSTVSARQGSTGHKLGKAPSPPSALAHQCPAPARQPASPPSRLPDLAYRRLPPLARFFFYDWRHFPRSCGDRRLPAATTARNSNSTSTKIHSGFES